MDCLFCRMVAGTEKGRIVFEDEHHVAFLTPFPNTPGFTVLVTREHRDSHVFGLEEDRFSALLKTARRLALHLDKKLGTRRTGLIIEGLGIDHAHIKLIPMHGIPEGEWKPMLSSSPQFSELYNGYLTSKDGPRMSDHEMDEIMKKITS